MRVETFLVLHNFCDDSFLTSSIPLDDPDRLTDLKALSDMVSLSFDLDRLGVLSQEVDIAVMDLLDLAIALFELTFGHLDSISNLNLKLGVISDSPAESLIIQEIPLVLIVIIELVEVRLSCRINLEHFYLLEARTHVLGDQLRCVEFLVQEAVSEHHFSPDVEILAQRLDVLLLAFVLHSEWVE